MVGCILVQMMSALIVQVRIDKVEKKERIQDGQKYITTLGLGEASASVM